MYEPFKDKLEKALKETIQWYQQSGKEDKRNDNLSAVMLSRFMEQTSDFQWHIIFGKLTPPSASKQGKVITNH